MRAPTSARTAVVAGATGLVGTELLRLLTEAPEYSRVVALARRPPAIGSPKLVVRRARFDALADELADLRAAPVDVFCCLGTTIAAAGSQLAFRVVDHDYVLAVGRWARDAHARRLLVVSALGADPASRVFYNRVKGETERDLAALGLESLVIVRPSLLDGDRAERRTGERLAILAARPLRGLLPASVRPVRARDVAASLLLATRAETTPRIVDSAQMHGAAERI